MSHQTWDLLLAGLLAASWIALLYVMVFPPIRWAEPDVPAAVRSAVEVPRADAPPPAPVTAPRSTSTHMVTVRLLCQDEKDQHVHLQVPAMHRKPTFTHGGGCYVYSRRDLNGDYIYRWDRKA